VKTQDRILTPEVTYHIRRMGMKIFTMHKLKQGTLMEDYKKWSREVDYPKSIGQQEILTFEVYEILGSVDSDKMSPEYDIIEVIEVESLEDIQKVEERLKSFLEDEWIARWVEKSNLINLYGEKI
jgi:hypothetical protein